MRTRCYCACLDSLDSLDSLGSQDHDGCTRCYHAGRSPLCGRYFGLRQRRRVAKYADGLSAVPDRVGQGVEGVLRDADNLTNLAETPMRLLLEALGGNGSAEIVLFSYYAFCEGKAAVYKINWCAPKPLKKIARARGR